MHNNISDDKKLEFALHEYQLLQNFRNKIIEQVDKRVNFFITIGIFLFASISFMKEFGLVGNRVIVPILSILVYFGYITFERIIQGHLSIIFYTRGINRIRKMFVGNNPMFKKFFLLPMTDSQPTFGTYGFSSVKTKRLGVMSMIIFLNMLFFSMLIYFIISEFLCLGHKTSVILTIISALISLIFHRIILKKRIKKSKNKFNIEFPENEE